MDLHAVVRLSCVFVKVPHELLMIALHPVIYIRAIMRKMRCMPGCACEDIQASCESRLAELGVLHVTINSQPKPNVGACQPTKVRLDTCLVWSK